MTTVFVWNRKFHTLNGTCWIELNQQKATNSFFPCNNLSVIFGWTSSHRQNVHQRANVHLFPVGHSRCYNVTHNILRQLQVKLLFSVVVICCCCCISFIGVFFSVASIEKWTKSRFCRANTRNWVLFMRTFNAQSHTSKPRQIAFESARNVWNIRSLSVTFSISMQIDEVFNSKDLGCRFRCCFFFVFFQKNLIAFVLVHNFIWLIYYSVALQTLVDMLMRTLTIVISFICNAFQVICET